jgi:hypothetical protein
VTSTHTIVINMVGQIAGGINFSYKLRLMLQNGSIIFMTVFWTQISKFGPVVEMDLQDDSSNFPPKK